MKKIFKIFSILFVIVFICGCMNDDISEKPIKKEDDNVIKEKNIKTSEVAFFNGEYNQKNILLKVENNNTEPVYLNYSFEVFDKNKIKRYNIESYVRVGSNNSAYVFALQGPEESSFDSYSYKMSVLKDKLDNYDKIKKTIYSSYSDNGKKIIVNFNNKGNTTTSVYGLLFFYKDNSLVAVKEVKSFHLIPGKTDTISINYPIKTVNKKISFDRFELITNEVSTEL